MSHSIFYIFFCPTFIVSGWYNHTNAAGGLTKRLVAGYHGAHDHRQATMNDLPVPSGDWQEQYARQNAKHNAWLIAGFAIFVGTLGFVKSSNIIEFNAFAPKSID